MGIIKKIILLALLSSLFLGCATAQNYPELTRSGIDYYVYTVEPGNTVFAISQLFSVSVTDLIESNPEAKKGLSIGQEIYVPKRKIDKKKARQSEVAVEGEYLIHTVQKKETLFSIAGKYGVNVNEVMELNPTASTSIGVGDLIKIPLVESNQTKEIYLEPARNDTFIVHQVKKGETAYSLAKHYDITVDSLNKVNLELKDGLSIGQWIVIPEYKDSFKAQLNEEAPADTLNDIYPSGEKLVYKIGLMLPFELAHNDSLERTLLDGKELYILTEIALDFYRGVLIALDSLKKIGLTADVYVYDVADDLVGVKETLRNSEIKNLNLIFGPMHKRSMALVSDASKKNRTYLVSPNSFANEVFEDNPYLIRAMASRETLMRYLANFVAIQHPEDNVIMMNSESAKDWPYRKLFIENYNKAVGTFPNAFSDSLRSATISMARAENVSKWLKKDQLNVLVVPSNELAFVSDFMTRLSRVDSEYEIQVYGLDNWIRYDNIEAQYKNRFKLRLVIPNFVDYTDNQTIAFLAKYRDQYKMEPTQYGYGFLGYDLALFFGKILIDNGLGFPNAFGTTEMNGVNANYRFGKSTTGQEFENKSVYILEYRDFEIKQVN